jgi:pimeloyl-ACP methyl ester carboxylesterase
MTSVEHPDYAFLDRLGAGAFIFYPRPEWTRPPPGAQDHMVEVGPGVAVAVREYLADHGNPTVLFFHGNGEVASDYDGVAPMYHDIRLNLVVADFRGYGKSNGRPTVASLVGDALAVNRWFHGRLDGLGFSSRRFVMGRSLGTHPALEIAANGSGVEGLIVESGAANLERMIRRFIPGEPPPEALRLAERHREKVERIRLPALILHGEDDELIPLEAAAGLYDMLPGEQKRLVVIPGAGHNDIMVVGWRQYFEALREFVHGPRA